MDILNTFLMASDQPPFTLWLDLENTIIKSWEEPQIINLQRIKTCIKTIDPKKLIFFHLLFGQKKIEIFLIIK